LEAQIHFGRLGEGKGKIMFENSPEIQSTSLPESLVIPVLWCIQEAKSLRVAAQQAQQPQQKLETPPVAIATYLEGFTLVTTITHEESSLGA